MMNKEHYDKQLKTMCDKYNKLLKETNKEISDYGKELSELRSRLDTAKEAIAILKTYAIARDLCYDVELQKRLKELDGEE